MKLFIFVLFQVFICVSAQNTNESAQALVTEDLGTINSIKVYHEYKTWVDIDYYYRFLDRFNYYKGEFYAALEELVYTSETSKREALRSALTNNPDIICIQMHEEAVNIARRTGQVEFDACESNVRSNVTLEWERLLLRKEKIYDENRKAELRVECKRVYTLNSNIEQYKECIDSTKSMLVDGAATYNINIKGAGIRSIFIELAKCADKSLSKIQTLLSENYKSINECLNSSGNPLSNQLVTFINTHNVDLTSLNLGGQATKAFNHIKTNAEELLQSLYKLRGKFQVFKDKRDRGDDEIMDFLMLGKEYNAYKLAYIKAQKNVTVYSKSSDCFNQVNYRNQQNVYANAIEVRLCIRGFDLIPTEGEVWTTIVEIKNRDYNEGLVAVVNCFVDRKKTLYQNLTLSCSATADASYSIQESITKERVKLYNNQLDFLSKLFKTCEKAVVPSLSKQLSVDRFEFEFCVQNKGFINYQLDV